MKSFLIAAAAAAIPFLAVASAAPVPASDPIELARVNGEAVTDADLKHAFVGKHGGHTVFLGGATEARRFLDIVINERLLVQEGYTLGLDEDPAIKPQVDELRERKAAEVLLKQEIDEKSVPTGEEILAAWELADELFLAREIVVETREEAESLHSTLLGGADSEELARRCSIAPSRTRGGSLSPFTWGSLALPLEQAAFALQPGEFSKPFRTSEGWAVLYMIDRLDAFRPELDEKVRAKIAAKLTERKKEARTAELSAILWQKFEAKAIDEKLTATGLARMMAKAPETEVATWKGGALTLKDAFTPGELRMFAALTPARAADQIDATLREAVNTALIKLEARERRIAEVAAVAGEVDRFEAKLIEGLLYAKHVLTGVKVEDDEVRASYEQQKGQLMLGERRRVAHIAVATEDEAEKLRERIRRGEDFLELLRSHTLDKAGLKNAGDLGWIEKGKVAEKYAPLFELPQNGVSEPIRSDQAWHLVRVNEIQPERPLSFEEAREKIRTTLLEKKKHDARERWIAKLREAGQIEINEAGIEAFVKLNPYEGPGQ